MRMPPPEKTLLSVHVGMLPKKTSSVPHCTSPQPGSITIVTLSEAVSSSPHRYSSVWTLTTISAATHGEPLGNTDPRLTPFARSCIWAAVASEDASMRTDDNVYM